MNSHRLPFVLFVKEPERIPRASEAEIRASQEPLARIPLELAPEYLDWSPFPNTEATAMPEETADGAQPHEVEAALSEIEAKLLRAVADHPGEKFSVYARMIGRNSTKAAQIRNELIEKGYLKEHRLNKAGVGAKAMVLELLPKGRTALERSVV